MAFTRRMMACPRKPKKSSALERTCGPWRRPRSLRSLAADCAPSFTRPAPSSKARLMFSAVTGSPRICSLSAAVVALGTTIQRITYRMKPKPRKRNAR